MGTLCSWSSWVGNREGVQPVWKVPLQRKHCALHLRIQGSQGGASWKGSCLGCDESSLTEEAGTSLGVEPRTMSGSACLQTKSLELMRKQMLLLKGALPWLRELGVFPLPVGIVRQCLALPGSPGFLPDQQGFVMTTGTLRGPGSGAVCLHLDPGL